MDDETILKFITGQNADLKKDFRGSIADLATTVSSRVDDKIEIKMEGVNVKLDNIIEQKVIQNGRIARVENNIKQTRKETGLFRWMHRNPAKAIVAIVILFGGLAYGFHKVDIKKSFEKKTGIYFKDTTTHSVERKPIL